MATHNASFILHLRDEQGPTETARLSAGLASALSRTRVVEASLATRPSSPGERADMVPILGQIVVAFVGGGAASALVNVLSGWLHRTTTSVEITAADGRSIKITGSDLVPERVEPLVRSLERFMSPPLV